MATDLFGNYYNNPQKQAIYSNLVCPGASSDDELKFTINNGLGQISNNKDVFSAIDLSKISSSLSEWDNSSKIIPANSIYYVQGQGYGESYKRIVYGKFYEEFIDYIFNNEIKLNFMISYLKDNSFPCTDVISVSGYSLNEIVENINSKFNDIHANVECEIISFPDRELNELLSFQSNKLGYDFYIDNVSYYIMCADIDNGCHDGCECYHEFPMEEVLSLYIPAKKYRNGAHKGLIIVPTYPKYNANNISSDQKALAITHINDRVNMFFKTDNELYKKHTFDVFGDLSIAAEYDNCIIFNDKTYIDDNDISDNWLNDDNKSEFTIVSNGMKVLSNKVLGLYGYCNYVTINNLWNRFGDMYCVIGASDIENSNTYNYVNGAIIYNPNDFDIKVNIMTWN